jgi:hypothetical protein
MFGTTGLVSLIKPIQLAHADQKTFCQHFNSDATEASSGPFRGISTGKFPADNDVQLRGYRKSFG